MERGEKRFSADTGLATVQLSRLTVELKRDDWSDSDVAKERPLQVLGEENRCNVSAIAPAIGANFRWINDFEVVPQVSGWWDGNGKPISDGNCHPLIDCLTSAL
jgi:hypothetical protein